MSLPQHSETPAESEICNSIFTMHACKIDHVVCRVIWMNGMIGVEMPCNDLETKKSAQHKL